MITRRTILTGALFVADGFTQQQTSPAGVITATGSEATFVVDYPRPLESLVYTFVNTYRWQVTFEEAPLEHPVDRIDVTRDPAAKSRSFRPRGGPFSFRYDLGPGGSPPASPKVALEAAIAAYNASILPGRYRLAESPPYWHIVPTACTNASGDLVEASSPFDILISQEARERSLQIAFEEMITTIEAVSGHQILVGFSPFGRGDQTMVEEGFLQVSGREVLRRLLGSLGNRYVWYLMKDPGKRRYGLSIVLL